MANQKGPIQSRVGAELVQQHGTINGPLAGGLATPLELLKSGLLAYLDLETTATIQVVQPASAGAVTNNTLGPWDIVQSAQLRVGGSPAFDQSLGGYAMNAALLYDHPALATSGAAFLSDPLPGANSGTQAVTTNESWAVRHRMAVSVDENDLTGMVMLESSGAAYLTLRYRPPSDFLTLPNSSTATYTALQTVVTGYGYEVGQVTVGDLSFAHIREQTPFALNEGIVSTQIPLQVGIILQQLLIVPTISNAPDQSAQIDFSTWQLQLGAYRPRTWNDTDLLVANAVADRADGVPAGTRVLNFKRNRPYGYQDWRNIPQALLNVTFGTSVPANAGLWLVYEYLRPVA